jgi:plastocyanin
MNNMNVKKLSTLVILFIVLMPVGFYIFTLLQSDNYTHQTTTSSPSSEQNSNSGSQSPGEVIISEDPVFSGEQEIILDQNGFSPNSITISKGTLVQWINKSGADATVNSKDHPTHKLYTDLNLGIFQNDSSISYIFNTPGTYTYHDHINSHREGTIIVE